jgi:mannose-6-phosphate isomerase-like protein (cupin superfamily)
MAPMRVERWDVRLDGTLSEEALQRKIESLGFEISARTYPAGLAAAAPVDGREALVGVVRGLVKVTVDGEAFLLTAGDVALVRPGGQRRVEVVGPSTAVCLEAFRPVSPS